ncbi:MAG: hypothetical protein J6V32_02460 [Elusimicrobiaceae bacterium]|nr:hypothetical protein [Elusimicrobiaceae bacterium]
MSETTQAAVESTDLTVSPVAADAGVTSQEGPIQADTDSPAQQETNPQDSLQNWSEPEKLPFTADDFKAFKTLAQECKLSPAQVDKWLAFQNDCAMHQTQFAQAQKREQVANWANQTRAAYGAGLEQEITFALRAADTFGGPELRELLEETGLGNHPVVIRTLSGIGRTISEDASLGGQPSAPQDKTFAEALYGRKN